MSRRSTWMLAFLLLLALGSRARGGELLLGEHETAVTLDTAITIEVTGIVATTEVHQTFENRTSVWQEATYRFPLPDDAAVRFMQMTIGSRVITGRIREKVEARALYEKAKREGRAASLAEQHRPNIFRQAVANIPPGERVEVTLRFLHLARFEDGNFQLRLPLTITPRYKGTAENTPVAFRTDGPPAAITARLHAGVAVDRFTSHRQTERVNRHRDTFELSATVAMDSDLNLTWTPAASSQPTVAFFGEQVEGRDYGLAMVFPPTGATNESLAKEVVFVLDTSGSMKGAAIRQAKASVLRAIGALPQSDLFNVVQFNSDFTMLFDESRFASPENRDAATGFVEMLEADGGTEMAAPINAALSLPSTPGLLKHVIFLTDGAIGDEHSLLRLIHEILGDARLFTVGIGSAPNSYFMRKAAEFGRGSYLFISDVNEVAHKTDLLFHKIEQPLARDLRLDWRGSAGVDVYPRRMPALYGDEPLVLFASAEVLQGELAVSATTAAGYWETQVPVATGRDRNGVSTLWARARIQSLEDELTLGAPESTIRPRILTAALTHQLVSRYTSLVAVEEFVSRRPGDETASAPIANRSPAGRTVSIPATATHGPAAWLAGLVALALAIMLQLGGRIRWRKS